MRRVVVTGMGVVSCLGNDTDTVSRSLRESRSGIRFKQAYEDIGMRSRVAGWPDIDFDEHIDRKPKRFMGDAAAYAYIALNNAIEHAGLEPHEVSNERTGLVAGSGGHSSENSVNAADIARERGVKKVGPYMVPRVMSSTVSACLATPFKIKGVNYSIGSACATSAHCIGNAVEQIQLGKQDVMFAGGGEEEHWTLSILFDAMGALTSKYNDTPARASRAYDAGRDGFVIAGGGGMLVLEELEHAKARGANIIAEVTGYGATSDGDDMVAPSGEGAVRCMKQATANVEGPIDYINAHGTSTPAGDIVELNSIGEFFGGPDKTPPVSSTKSLTGHSLGAAGVHETIYSLLMMRDGFIAGSAHIENLDEDAAAYPVVQESRDAEIRQFMTNSFGFGGTNASLVLRKWEE